jgi:secondary thiamine-phosphate synthase enzyme
MICADEITLSTRGFADIVDITPQAIAAVKKSGIADGILIAFIVGSTASITTVEYEPGLIEDLKTVLERLVPTDGAYAHNQAWGDGNGFSHVRAALMGPGRTFPVKEGKISLGTWQQIVVIDFDNRPRQRKVVLQVMGEKDR